MYRNNKRFMKCDLLADGIKEYELFKEGIKGLKLNCKMKS